jgi:hypothetical protein
LAVVGMLMVVVTAVIVMMAGVIVVARVGIVNLCNVPMLPVLMRLARARASMMETAPEYRVQQHYCNGDKFARGDHAEVS